VPTKPRDPQNVLTLRSGWIHSQLGFGLGMGQVWSSHQNLVMNIHKNIIYIHLPSGKHTKSYGKSPFFMGNPTISMAIFNSYFDITRGYIPNLLWIFGYLDPQKTHKIRSSL
jgi:hypothetical protein